MNKLFSVLTILIFLLLNNLAFAGDDGKIEKIVNAIVRKLENSGETDIKSNIIGQYIMEALMHLDQVAYVRFASVYKNFREAKDFEDFLGNLEDK